MGDAIREVDAEGGHASGESAADVLVAGEGIESAVVEDDGTLEAVVASDTCLLPRRRGDIRTGTWRGARKVACWPWKLKVGGACPRASISTGEDIARDDVAVDDEEPCSNSDNGRGLGVVMGVEASDSGGVIPSGPC